MTPFIPALLAGTFLGSLIGLTWYDSLTVEQQRRADLKAQEIAMQLFKKGLDALSATQLSTVWDKVREYF